MSPQRRDFLTSLAIGATVHLAITDDERVDAVVSAVTRSGFVVVTADFRTTVLDREGYVKGSVFRRIEPAGQITAEQWNTVARDMAADSRQALQARARLRYGIGANTAFKAA